MTSSIPHRPHARVILIAVSTGGPPALIKLLPELSKTTSLPIVVVQHMPPGFTAALAQNLDRICQGSVREAQEGDTLQNNHIYIAPGGLHLELHKQGTGFKLHTQSEATELGCRPAANVLLRSAIQAVGGQCVVLILTGMGRDGTEPLAHLHSLGAAILAQDEQSSVVWGMPKSAWESGYVHALAPLERLPEYVQRVLRPLSGPGA